VYLSLVVRPELLPAQVPPLALAMGVAAREALIFCGAPIVLKWPNDLLVNGRKLGGILIEMSTCGMRVPFAIVGIGVNVNGVRTDWPEEVRDRATALAEWGGSVPRERLVAGLLERMEHWYERFVAEGVAPCARAFRAAAGDTLGRRVRVAGDSEPVLEGIAEDVTEQGALLIRDDAGMLHRVVAGEILL
jgi:BirA family biotin operon repressor/biotin-[acetyl-CoA-carboxylase] ligase